MAYEIISQNNTVTTLADENGNVIRVPARVILTLGATFSVVKINNNLATLEDSDGKVYRDIPCVLDLSNVTGYSVSEVNNSSATMEDSDGIVHRGIPCVANLTGSGGSTPVIEELNVTPSTSAQTITATGGVDGYSPVNVSAVDASIDANITTGNIKSGVTILGVTGNVVELNGETVSVTPTTSSQTITPTSPKNAITEVSVSAVTSSIDANITAGNIKKDVTILGVTGTYEGGGGSGTPQPNVKKSVYNGILMSDGSELIDLTGVTKISDYTLAYAYYGTNITSLSWTNSFTIGQYALLGAFYNCAFTNKNVNLSGITGTLGFYALQSTFTFSNIESLDLSNVTQASLSSMYHMCSNCSSLVSVNLCNLTIISGGNALDTAFSGCSSLASVDVSGIEEIQANSAMNSAFANCTSLTKMYFSSLSATQNITQPFGRTAALGSFTGCTGITEIHFPANTQTYIESTTGYSTQWGASNATVYFDLPSTYTLTGADSKTYKRNPKGDSASSLGWYDTATGRNTTFYTSGTSDPSTSDTIYSDAACTTPVTTISSIA